MGLLSDPNQFKAAQRRGWDSVADGWRKWWKPIEDGAQKVSDKLIELADIRPHHKVLDIATGIAGQTLERQEEIWDAVTDAAQKYADSKGTMNLDNEVMFKAGRR